MVGGIGSRHEAREEALNVLYEADVRGEDPLDILSKQDFEVGDYCQDVVRGVAESVTEIDQHLDAVANDWSVDRMPVIDRTILRMATFELTSRDDVPTTAVVSEAVELASQYSTEKSGRFVNGVLARLAADLRPDGADSVSVQ